MEVRDVITIKEAIELMRREQVLRLSVVSPDGVLQGILSIKDVMPHSIKGGGENKENVQRCFTPGEQKKESYLHLAPSEETPPAYDSRGYTPLERVFNEKDVD
jgi:CBS domain